MIIVATKDENKMVDTKKYPMFRLRMNQELYDWLRDYSQRVDKSMSAIIKDYLGELKRKDLSVQRPAQRKASDV
jgi:hypothetical protein